MRRNNKDCFKFKEVFRPAGVIFDMDGVLFDSEKTFVSTYEEAGKHFGYNITRDFVLSLLGMSGEELHAVVLEHFGNDFPYEQIRDYRRLLYRKELEKNGVPKKPGLDYLLDHLAAAKIPIALATAKSKEMASFCLSNAGILDRFTAIICSNEVKNGKPAPDIFFLAAERLGQPPSACVGFEDSVAGLKGLSAAGIRSIFIKDLVEPPKEILATVWQRCNDLSEAVILFGLAEKSL